LFIQDPRIAEQCHKITVRNVQHFEQDVQYVCHEM